MSVSLRRKLYARGGSFETTVPLHLLLDLDMEKHNDVIFEYDAKTGRWYIRFEQSRKKRARESKKGVNR